MTRTKKTARASVDRSEAPAPERAPASGRQARFLRLVLMVGGALAAPSLALAAFFFTDTADPAPTKSAGHVTTTTRAAAAPAAAPVAAPASTTTTTTAPIIPSAAGLRDPFAPLVQQGPAAGAPAR